MLLQVTELFKDDQELILGFHHFLPDRNAQQRMAARLDELADGSKQSDGRHGGRKKPEPPGGGGVSSSRSGGAPAVPQKRKRKPAAERERDQEREREKHKEIAPKPGPSKVRIFLNLRNIIHIFSHFS